ncbi:hypothetical protein [Gloeobacter violaceus]|uniref:Glr0185 protein n=1 Tax=Gloeobacter violaceus (strain ATCC 29082 / PCC 7421) TaxID=251221 RepID=Q7NP72_GLOVI|nr:hypothetical protein [Gloeobacter violaceus]BAC88126.1 glr0185 [Gloeobacter violaceus PCC 7421]
MKNAQTVGWNLWLQWVLAYALGSLAGGAIARPLGEAVGSVLGAAVAGLVVGAALGLAQAVVLGRYLKAGTPWIRATALGSALGSLLGGTTEWLALNRMGLPDLPSNVLGMTVVGACLGVAQWWAVRKQFPQFGWWILGNTIALAIGPIVTLLAVLALGYFGPALTVFLRPLVSAAVSGGVLVGLLREAKIE